MIRISFRPPVGDPAWDTWVADGQAAVQRMLTGAVQPTIDGSLYKRQRDRLLAATYRKCAYCEIALTAGQRKGDVEHYRPKGAARGLDGKLVKVRRADGTEVKHPGYYWLAYDYRNLLPSCSACNRRAGDAVSGTMTGKSDIFPTLDERWAGCPEDVASEQPALLNPLLASDDPAKHLLFDPDTGRVMGTTERGRITIQVLGLNRDGLPEDRLAACRNVRRALKQFAGDAARDRVEDEDEALLTSVKDGSAEYAAICRAALQRGIQRLNERLAALSMDPDPDD